LKFVQKAGLSKYNHISEPLTTGLKIPPLATGLKHKLTFPPAGNGTIKKCCSAGISSATSHVKRYQKALEIFPKGDLSTSTASGLEHTAPCGRYDHP